MKNLKTNIYFKIIAIVFIVLLLLIPAVMIRGLINEREYRQKEAINEVSSKWANQQTIKGPFVSIPYYKYVKEKKNKNIKGKTVQEVEEKVIRIKEYIHLLPTELDVEGEIFPEKRYRGLYEVVVYQSQLKLSGSFKRMALETLNIPEKDILFHNAEFVLGIDDLRGIKDGVELQWNEQKIPFNSGSSSQDIVASGINAVVKLNPKDSTSYNFSLNLSLKGSQLLYFTPVGKTTDVTMASKWSNPSFNGAFLPDEREVTESGFTAHWNVLHLNRNYPQVWTTSDSYFSVNDSEFGVDLLLPVDSYQKSYRSAKYAILFIGLTFLVFFFIEVMNKIFIHPVQYILVGVALLVFYTLLLSISEYINYNWAFLVSAVATLLLISGYVFAILKSRKLTLFIVGLLAVLYLFIFVIIQLQDYALLVGSVGLFLILASVMYFSRKIDWYSLNLKEKE